MTAIFTTNFFFFGIQKLFERLVIGGEEPQHEEDTSFDVESGKYVDYFYQVGTSDDEL